MSVFGCTSARNLENAGNAKFKNFDSDCVPDAAFFRTHSKGRPFGDLTEEAREFEIILSETEWNGTQIDGEKMA